MSTSTAQHAHATPGMTVVGMNGLAGEVEQVLDGQVIVRLRDGTRVVIRDHATAVDAGVLRVRLSDEQVAEARRNAGAGPDTTANSADRVIPVLEERVHVDVHPVEVGSVRVVKRVETEEHEIEQPVTRTRAHVERVPLGTVVDADNPPAMRHEGDVLVVPVLEEVLVIEKRLVLKEELRITRTREESVSRLTATTRHEHVDVERVDADQPKR